MLEKTSPNSESQLIPPDEESAPTPLGRTSKRPKGQKYPPDADIDAWLRGNSPHKFQALADIRYCLYHRCSRADFTVTQKFSDDHFMLSGRHSELRIICNKARRYLLWKLRLLGREVGWIGALPRTRKPREPTAA
jgi:hypothetical protein